MLFIQAANNPKNLKLHIMKLNMDLLKKIIPYSYQIVSTGLIVSLLVIVMRQQSDINSIKSRVNNIPTSTYDNTGDLSNEINEISTKLESVQRRLSSEISSAESSISSDISSAESNIKWELSWRCN